MTKVKSDKKFKMKEKNTLFFKGLCTHYAGAESISNYFRVEKQILEFNKAITIFSTFELHPIIKFMMD